MTSAITVPVRIPGYSYDITIQPGLLVDAGDHLARLTRSRKVGIITDTNVGPIYLQAAVNALQQAGFEVFTHATPAGEHYKTLGRTSRILDAVLEAAIDRATPLVALGGGLVGDMTGFASAIALRGIPFIQIPTTLLSMVDASVGGKTGVNHRLGKNLIGAFHQPIAVLVDPETLRTLPPRELRGGLAECIKHEIIRDPEGFARLEQNIGRAIQLDTASLTELVAHNVAIKARVVEADPFENGERAHLNFGHTFGHAIETVSNYEYSHGESVALGMVAATKLSVRMGLIDEPSLRRIIRLIASAGLPTGGLKIDISAVINAMLFDKKAKAGRVRFVLPDKIGHVVIRDDVPPAQLHEALDLLRHP